MTAAARIRRILLLLAAVLGACAWATSPAVAGPAQQVRLAVGAPPAAQRSFARLTVELRSGNWERALEEADRIAQEFPEALFEFEPGWLLSGRLLRTTIVGGLDSESLLAYRQSVEPQAEALQPMGTASSLEHRLSILERFPHSREAVETATMMGDRAWRNGELDQARRFWTSALVPPSAPALVPENAELLVRLAVCDVVEGKVRSARQVLERLGRVAPESEGMLGGASGKYVDLLADLIADADLPSGAFSRPTHVEFLRERWRAVGEAVPTEPPRGGRCLGAAALNAWGGVLLESGPAGVRALEMSTGAPAWPTGAESDEGWIYRPRVLAAERARQVTPRAGVISGEAWYGAANSELTGPADPPHRSGFDRLVALDLAAEGLIRWIVEADEVAARFEGDLDREGWLFTGAVAVEEEQLLASMRGPAQSGLIGLVSVDRQTGTTTAVRMLPTTHAGMPSRTADWLSATGTTVYWNIDGTIVAALQRSDLRLLWATAIPGPASEGEVFSPLPRLLHDGASLFASGARGVCRLDLETGRIEWSADSLSPVGGIAGIRDDTLIVAGHHLWGINALDGRIFWRTGFDDDEVHGTGAAALIGRSCLWSTDEELWTVDCFTGAILRRIPLVQLGLAEICSIVPAGDSLVLGSTRAVSVLAIGTNPNLLSGDPVERPDRD